MSHQNLTFENDLLKRDIFCKNVTNALFTYSNSVFFIEGKWGTGKTFLANMWANELRNDSPFGNSNISSKVIVYDSWVHDDWGDPLTPIVDCIKNSVKDDNLDNFVEVASYIGGVLSKRALSIGASIAIDSITGFSVSRILKKAGSQLNNLVDESYKSRGLGLSDEFMEYKKKRKSFKDELARISQNKPLVVFVDELDRAKPDFALNTLEIMKHLFDVENVYFIVMINDSEFGSIIGNKYGNEIKSKDYLRKFYDQLFYIPESDVEEFISKEVGKYAESKEVLFDDYLKKRTIQYFIKLCIRGNLGLRNTQKLIIRVMQYIRVYHSNNISEFHIKLATITIYLYMFGLRDRVNDPIGNIIIQYYKDETGKGLKIYCNENNYVYTETLVPLSDRFLNSWSKNGDMITFNNRPSAYTTNTFAIHLFEKYLDVDDKGIELFKSIYIKRIQYEV